MNEVFFKSFNNYLDYFLEGKNQANLLQELQDLLENNH